MSESFQKVQAIFNSKTDASESLNYKEEKEKNENIEENNIQILSVANPFISNTNIIVSSDSDAVSLRHNQANQHQDATIIENETLPHVLIKSDFMIAENFIVHPALQQAVAKKIVQGHPLDTPPHFTTNDPENDVMLVPVEDNFFKDLFNTIKAHPSLTEQPFEKDLYLYHFATLAGKPAVLAYLIQAWDQEGLLDQFLALPKPTAWQPISLNNLFLQAIRANDAAKTELYLRAGADHEAISSSYNQAVHLAAKRGHLNLIKLLVEKKINLNLITEHAPWSALHWAAKEGHVEVIRYLLQQGVSIDIKDQTGKTPLFWLLTNQRIDPLQQKDCLIELIEQEAFVLAQDAQGNTPLHALIQINHKMIPTILLQLLLAAGADIHLKNKTGQTPLDYAEAKHPLFKEALLRQASQLKKRQHFSQAKQMCSQLTELAALYSPLPQKPKESEQLSVEDKVNDDFEWIDYPAENESAKLHKLKFNI